MTVFNDNTLYVENMVAEFESGWDPADPNRIHKLLDDELKPTVRMRSLWELVETDLELRVKNGEQARVEDYVEEFPALLEDQERFCEFIFSEYRLRSRRELDLTRDSFVERFPILADQLHRMFDKSRSSGSNSNDSSQVPGSGKRSRTIGAPTSKSGRFRLLEPHEEGGLGKVWIAYDCELNREVALKEIKARFADDETSRVRFATEAMVTSGLEHPGIVPVYGFGQYSDGRPYYTMRFVRGSSFRDAIREFHEKDWTKEPSGARSVEMRRMLSQFLDVCNTIHYAHQRGVLHRDLKPGNIMLGDYGETLVVDWGLAKTIGDMELPQSPSSIAPNIETLRSDTIATRLGKALGSPAYMSPEQARGEHDQLGPSTDVYSLGATLYTLLTNERPIRKGDQTEELLESVQQGDWPRPRAIRSGIPAALEAICLKAMQLQPEERYDSALAMGADIERFLADEPTTAFRENLFHRFSRFVRRNDALVRAIALALITVATTSFVAALSIDEQRRIAEDSAKSESEARKTALLSKIEAQQSRDRAQRLESLVQMACRLRGESGKDLTLLESFLLVGQQLPGEPYDVGLAKLDLASKFIDMRAFDQASEYASSGVELIANAISPDAPDAIDGMKIHAEALSLGGEAEASLAVRQSMLAILDSSNPHNQLELIDPLVEFATWAADSEFIEPAVEAQTRACNLLNAYGTNSARTLSERVQLARLLHQSGESSEAIELLNSVIKSEGLTGSDSITISAMSALSAIKAELEDDAGTQGLESNPTPESN